MQFDEHSWKAPHAIHTFTASSSVPMIARAMKTRQEQSLRYVDLARQGARLVRSLSTEDLPRWSQLVDGPGRVSVVLTFYRGEDGLPCVRGDYRAEAGLVCGRCLDVIDHAFSGSLDLCIVRDEARASTLAEGRDVLTVAGDQVLPAEIVEDELLLETPERLCGSVDCERVLPMSYPAATVEVAEAPNPFGALARLKDNQERR